MRYKCVKYLILPPGKDSQMWMPTFGVSNAVSDPFQFTHTDKYRIRLESDGTSLYSPHGNFQVRCALNLWNFPFDEQICSLDIEPYRYRPSEMRLKIGKFKMEHFAENDQWDVELVDARHENITYRNTALDKIVFEFKFRRKQFFYSWGIVLPCVAIAVVEMSTFAVPLENFVRLQLSFMSLLSFSVFQGIFQSSLPHSSDSPPFLFVYIGFLTISISIVTLFQGLSIYFHHVAVKKHLHLPFLLVSFFEINQNEKKLAIYLSNLCDSVGFYSFSSFIFFVSPVFIIILSTVKY